MSDIELMQSCEGVKILTSSILIGYFIHYGYLVLFSFLAVELIGLPLPGELLMSYAGFLVYQGRLNWALSIIVASGGIFGGITISYFIGSVLGYPFFKKYGHYVHITPARLQGAEGWYEKYGNNLIVAAYFIPGIRHITGYFAGIVKMPYRRFALRAYVGALIWASFFITLGKVIGPDWAQHQGALEKYLMLGAGIVFLSIFIFVAYRYHKDNIIALFKHILLAMLERYDYSKVRVFLVIAGVMSVFSTLVAFTVSLIQDYLANEFVLFDTFSDYLVVHMFAGNEFLLKIIQFAMSSSAIVVIVFAALLLIFWKSKMRLLDTSFLMSAVLGGEFIEEILRRIFHRLGPIPQGSVGFTFPSEQTFMIIVIYGYFMYLFLKYIPMKYHAVRVCTAGLFIAVMVFVGFNRIFYGVQYSSDVLAGYIFGGVWLVLNLIVMECMRLLKS